MHGRNDGGFTVGAAAYGDGLTGMEAMEVGDVNHCCSPGCGGVQCRGPGGAHLGNDGGFEMCSRADTDGLARAEACHAGDLDVGGVRR